MRAALESAPEGALRRKLNNWLAHLHGLYLKRPHLWNLYISNEL